MTDNITISFDEAARRMRNLLVQQRENAADLAELMLQCRASGVKGALLKKWLKAELADEEKTVGKGKKTRIQSLIEETEDQAIYGDSLGHNLGIVQDSTKKDFEESPHDPETGEIAPPVSPRTRAAAQRFVDSVAKNPGDSVSIEAGGRRTTISNVEGRKEITSEVITEPEPPKPHILTPSERDPLWEFEHRGMVDAASGQHRVPTDLAGEQLAAWQKGHDEKMAAIRERAA